MVAESCQRRGSFVVPSVSQTNTSPLPLTFHSVMLTLSTSSRSLSLVMKYYNYVICSCLRQLIWGFFINLWKKYNCWSKKWFHVHNNVAILLDLWGQHSPCRWRRCFWNKNNTSNHLPFTVFACQRRLHHATFLCWSAVFIGNTLQTPSRMHQ